MNVLSFKYLTLNTNGEIVSASVEGFYTMVPSNALFDYDITAIEVRDKHAKSVELDDESLLVSPKSMHALDNILKLINNRNR